MSEFFCYFERRTELPDLDGSAVVLRFRTGKSEGAK